MKKIVVTLATGLFLSATMIVNAEEVPTEAQLQQLFESIARVVPEKTRVVSLHSRETAPPSEADIKKIVDFTRVLEEKTQNGVPEPLRTQRIEQHIRLVKSAMTGKIYEKCQEWKSGPFLYRVDKAVSWDSLEEVAYKTNYDTTFINVMNKTNGAISKITINHDTKSFQIDNNNPQLWSEVGAWNAMIVEDRVAFFFGMNFATIDSIKKKAKNENQKLLMDPLKLRWFFSDQNTNIYAYLEEKVVDGEQLDEFKFGVRTAQMASILIECVKTNYNRITRTEIIGQDGVMALSSIRSGFDSQDFPHEYTLIENQGKGYVTNKFSIQEVELNAHFSDDEVFRFAPGTNYNVWDLSSGTAKIKSWANGIKPLKIIDTSTLFNKAHWFENPVLVRAIIFGVFLLPPIVLIFMALKKHRSKQK